MTIPRARRLLLAGPCLLAAALAPSAVAAADPQAAAFRKQARATLAGFRAEARATVRDARRGLTDLLAALEDGQLDHAAALEQAVTLAAYKRVALSNFAAQRAIDLAAAGNGLVEPGAMVSRDLQAGGQGAWDRTLDALASVLRRSDRRVRSGTARFFRRYDAVATGRGHDVQARLWFGPLDRRLDVELAPVGVDFGADRFARPARVFVHATIADGDVLRSAVAGLSFDPTVDLALTFPGGSLDLVVPVTADTFTLGFSFGSPDGGVLDVVVNGDLPDGPTQTYRTSLPGSAAEVDAAALREAFATELRSHARQLAKSQASALRLLRFVLRGIARQHVTGGLFTPATLGQGFGTLQGALGQAAQQLEPALTGPVLAAEAALSGEGWTAADVTGDFTPDGLGLYSRFLGRIQRRSDLLNDRAGRAFEGFVRRVLRQAAQRGETVAANVVAGRPGDLQGRVLSLDGGGSLVLAPTVTNAMIVAWMSGPTTAVTGYMGGQADTDEVLAVTTDVHVQGGQVAPVPLLAPDVLGGEFRGSLDLDETPLAGHLFHADGPSSRDSGLLFVVTPPLEADS